MILKMNFNNNKNNRNLEEKILWNCIFDITSPSPPLPTSSSPSQLVVVSSQSSSSSYGMASVSRVSAFLRILYAGILVISLVGNVNAKIGYFWHITDLHLDSFYSTNGDVLKSCWYIQHHQTSSSGRTPGRFGDYLCDSPWNLLESATLAMKSRQGDNVEFVLWTGDGLSHSAHRLLEKKRLEILRNITELLGRTFSSQFVFPVLGHEDGSNTNFHRLGELWRHWLPSEALQTFEKGGYYTIEQTKSRLRIIALNTNFMRHDPKYSQSQLAAVRQRQSLNIGSSSNSNGGGMDSTEYKNFYYHHGGGHHYPSDISGGYGYSASSHYGSNNNGYSAGAGGGVSGSSINSNGGQVSALSGYDNHETQKQWDWLEDVLAKSNRNKETVYIVGHIPPGSDERLFGSQQIGHTTYSEKNNLRYLRLVRKYSSIIQGQFFGHLHSDSFRIIYNDMGKPVSWIMISPSVTPRKMGVGSNNPAMRLYKFDTDSGQVLDYTQYYLDLATANSLGEANWMPEYNLTTHYFGLGDISAVSLHNLADRFTNSDSPSFAKYYRANSVRYPTQPCEGVCALNHYCAITRVDYREFRQCLETAASALASHSSGIHTNSMTTTAPLLLISIFKILFDMREILMGNFYNLTFKQIFLMNIFKLIIKNLQKLNNLRILSALVFVKRTITTTTKTTNKIIKSKINKNHFTTNDDKRVSANTTTYRKVNFHRIRVIKWTLNLIYRMKMVLILCNFNFKANDNDCSITKNNNNNSSNSSRTNNCISSSNECNTNEDKKYFKIKSLINNSNNKNSHNLFNYVHNKKLLNKINNNCQNYLLAKNVNVRLASDKIIIITFRDNYYYYNNNNMKKIIITKELITIKKMFAFYKNISAIFFNGFNYYYKNIITCV